MPPNPNLPGVLCQVRLLRSKGAGTSVLGAVLCSHKPPTQRQIAEAEVREDGVCEHCLFRQQWMTGHRREVDPGSGAVEVGLPSGLRSWRTTDGLRSTAAPK
mmetsp:Transcript_29459/g.65994  ORF Transcript_29459/g.65994 Transcript_29459/m.65994 type:complete len:102 (-) Transcript_29459:389-694(-)